jgi:hypothetical protein
VFPEAAAKERLAVKRSPSLALGMALDFQKLVEMLRGPLPRNFQRFIGEVRFTARLMGITPVCFRSAKGVDLPAICPISHGSSRICGTVDPLEGCRGMQSDPPNLLAARILDRC